MQNFVAVHVTRTLSVLARPACHPRLGGLRSAAAALGMLLVPLPAVVPAVEPLPDQVQVDMGIWFRRDWDNCESATKKYHARNTLHITSEQSTGLFWQVPTMQGKPLELDPAQHPWLDACKRPPHSFNNQIRNQGFDEFLDVSEFPYVTWRWKVDYAETKEQKVKPGEKLERELDDFPAKIGISILKKGSNSIREVAYVWSGSLPEDLMFKSETTIIPFVWKLEWRRFVAQSGLEKTGQWIAESRNLYEDFKRGYPGEEPGKVLRIYLMTDTDNTEGRAATWYGDITFHKDDPGK